MTLEEPTRHTVDFFEFITISPRNLATAARPLFTQISAQKIAAATSSVVMLTVRRPYGDVLMLQKITAKRRSQKAASATVFYD